MFADSFKKVAVVETKWLRHDRARDLLDTEEMSEELMKASVKTALIKAFQDNREKAKVDVAFEDKVTRLHVATDYPTKSSLMLVPLGVSIWIGAGKAPTGTVCLGACSVPYDDGESEEEEEEEKEEEEEEEEEGATKTKDAKFAFVGPPRFKSDQVIVPFGNVGTTVDSAKANLAVEKLSVPCAGFGSGATMEVPVYVNAGNIATGGELLVHVDFKGKLNKIEDDKGTLGKSEGIENKGGKGKTGKRRSGAKGRQSKVPSTGAETHTGAKVPN